MQLGKWIIVFGLVVTGIGVLVYFFHDKLQWFGNLPGDIKIKKENVQIFIPITSMLLLSLALSLMLWLFRGMKND
jgi:hypothetical protein